MSFLDLILIAFLLYMFFSGYSKGFFSTLYDLLSFIIMMLFIYLNVETISSIIQIYKPVDDPLSQLGGLCSEYVDCFYHHVHYSRNHKKTDRTSY